MEDSKNPVNHDEISGEKINEGTSEIRNKVSESINNSNNEINKNSNSKVNLTKNSFDNEKNKLFKDKPLEDDKNLEPSSELNTKINKTNNNIEKNNVDIIQKKIVKDNNDNNLVVGDSNLNKANYESVKNVDKDNKEIAKKLTLEENKRNNLADISNKKLDNSKEKTTAIPEKIKTKPVKVPPLEKKPFIEFVNDHLIPEIKKEFKIKGKEIIKINLQKTHRPITEDICWVIYCEIKDTCNFWLSFEKDDITSLKSFSLCKNYEKPSIIESFLIDEKKITLKLIISRILQRLNGQKLIGAN